MAQRLIAGGRTLLTNRRRKLFRVTGKKLALSELLFWGRAADVAA
jgi:hypothetical protein